MKYIKQHSYDISKFLINQFGISIFALCLTFSVGALSLSDIQVLQVYLGISVFSLGFYAVLLYTAAWDLGQKDLAKNEEHNQFSGLLLGAVSAFPQFLVAMTVFVTRLIYVKKGIEGFLTVSNILNIVQRIFIAQDIGVLKYALRSVSDTSDAFFLYQSLGFAVLCIVPIAAIGFGYFLGLKDKKLFELKSYNKK